MSSISLRDYFIPNPPTEWDLDSALKAKTIQGRIKIAAMIIENISSIVLMLWALPKAITVYKGASFTAVLLSSLSTPVIVTTVCVVSFIFLAANIANRNIKGLTSEMLLGFAIEQLKKEFALLKDNVQEASFIPREAKSAFRVNWLAPIVLPTLRD